MWLGNWDISGKTILLHGEQGLGDTIMFARYVPLVAQRGAKIVLAVQRPLTAVMTTLKGPAVIRGQGEPVPPFDAKSAARERQLADPADTGQPGAAWIPRDERRRHRTSAKAAAFALADRGAG